MKCRSWGGCPRIFLHARGQVMPEKGWKGMGDWLGTGTVATHLRRYRPFREARAFARKLELRSANEWRAYCEGEMPRLGRLPADIPSNAHRVYAARGWNSWGDWLGTDTVATYLRRYRPFREARRFARTLKLKSSAEWHAFCKGEMPQLGLLPQDIPANLQSTFAKTGWKGMGDWLGTGRIADHLKEYRPFLRARAFARKLKLKNWAEWRAFAEARCRARDGCPQIFQQTPI